MKDTLLTFFLLHKLEPSLGVIAFSDNIRQNVVLLPLAFLLVSNNKGRGFFAVDSLGLSDVFLLGDVFFLCVRESCAQKVEHIYYT